MGALLPPAGQSRNSALGGEDYLEEGKEER